MYKSLEPRHQRTVKLWAIGSAIYGVAVVALHFGGTVINTAFNR